MSTSPKEGEGLMEVEVDGGPLMMEGGTAGP